MKTTDRIRVALRALSGDSIVVSGPQSMSSIWSYENLISGEEIITVNTPVYDIYRKMPTIRECINLLAHFTTNKGFTIEARPIHEGGEVDETRLRNIERKVNEVNQLVNFDLHQYLVTLCREIWGRIGSEIVKSGRGDITGLLLLPGSSFLPVMDEKKMTIKEYKYSTVGGEEFVYPLEKVLYYVKDPIGMDQLGTSAIETVRNVCILKSNLEVDLREASKRLWAPFGMFQVDTSEILKPEDKEREMRAFADTVKPGQSIFHNKSIEGKIFDLKPDINGLVRALEKADEEIMGNWSVPKALLAREKTLSKATLEFSLKALYEGPVSSIQRYLKRENEKQWYPQVLESIEKGLSKLVVIRQHWRPVAFVNPELVRAMAYAVAYGAMTREEMFEILGWKMIGPTELPTDRGTRSPGSPDRQQFEDIVNDILDRRLPEEEPTTGGDE